jgi:hypothetical protein
MMAAVIHDLGEAPRTRTMCKQERRSAHVSLLACDLQRRRAIVATSVHCGATSEQPADLVTISELRREIEGRTSRASAHIIWRAEVHQELHQRRRRRRRASRRRLASLE